MSPIPLSNSPSVCVVAAEFPALSQTFVIDQVAGLIANGFSVTVVAETADVKAKSHPEYLKFEMEKRTTYTPIIYGFWARRLLIYVRMILGALLESPVETMRLLWLSMVLTGSASRNFQLFRHYRCLRKQAIFLCHFGQTGVQTLQICKALRFSSKVVTVFHGADVSRYLKQKGAAAYSELFRLGHAFLPISAHWKDVLIEHGCPPDKITVHRMGIDVSRFSFSSPTKTRTSTRMASIARLVEKKGLEYAIRALAIAIDLSPDTKFEYRIVGSGPLEGELQALIESLGLSQVVSLLGPQSNDYVRQLLLETDILLAPSVTAADGDMEGIPVSIMEAMAMGIPVISTRHSGIPELVIHNETGLLVNERDVDDLAIQIQRLSCDERLAQNLARSARETVAKFHDNTKLNADLARLLTSIQKV